MSDDLQLLQRFAQNGDQDAFAGVVRLHVDLLFREPALASLAVGAATFETVSARRVQTQLDSLRQSDSNRIRALESQLARTEAAVQNRQWQARMQVK